MAGNISIVTTDWCYWCLLGKDQGCCKMSYHAQDSPTAKDSLTRKVNKAAVEKHWPNAIVLLT